MTNENHWFSCVYSKDDLTRAVQHCNPNEASWKQPLRILLLAANLGNVMLIIHLYYPYYLILTFSNWTVQATSIYLALSICAHYKDKWLSVLALHHVWFEIMFMMNIITCTVFWSTLFNQTIADCNGHETQILNVYWTHLCPGISALIAFAITDVTIKTSHVKIINVVGFAYGFINYSETKKRGQPIYWFLTWEDETSFFIYVSLILVFSAMWFGLS
jgi:hypothetical protein